METTLFTVTENSYYRHFKGNYYHVLHIATHSETLEKMVVYQALYGERGVWVRPYAMFCEMTSVNGERVARFSRVQKADVPCELLVP